METLRHDLAYSLRLFAKNPGFTLVAILSLAMGIGANSAIFSVTNSLILRPLPYRDANRLVILWNRSPGLNIAQDWFSPAQYHDVKTQNHVFEETAITIGGILLVITALRGIDFDGTRSVKAPKPAAGKQPGTVPDA